MNCRLSYSVDPSNDFHQITIPCSSLREVSSPNGINYKTTIDVIRVASMDRTNKLSKGARAGFSPPTTEGSDT